jgi:hypothetical protein
MGYVCYLIKRKKKARNGQSSPALAYGFDQVNFGITLLSLYLILINHSSPFLKVELLNQDLLFI